MQHFRLNGKPHQLANSWSELSPAQVLALAPYLLAPPAATADRLTVLRLLCPALSRKVLARMDPADVLTLIERTGWLWSAPMQACPLTSFRLGGIEYLLWPSAFEGCVAIEYLMAEHYFRQFAKGGPLAPTALAQLVATLCRPRKAGLDERDPLWDGERRERYNSKVAELRAADELRASRLPVATQVVLLQYYVASARAFHQRYQELYHKPTAGQRGGGGGGGFGLLGTLDDVAVEGVFGTFEQVCYTDVHTVFFHLLRAHREARAHRAESAE